MGKALDGKEGERSNLNAVNPMKKIEADGVLNLVKGYEVDPIWSGFNEDFRAMLEDKFK